MHLLADGLLVVELFLFLLVLLFHMHIISGVRRLVEFWINGRLGHGLDHWKLQASRCLVEDLRGGLIHPLFLQGLLFLQRLL